MTTDTPKRVALYARVSKAEDQTTENQLLELRRWAQASEANVAGEWEESISSRDTRPKKEELLRKLRLGEIQGVAVVALSRWGRSLAEISREIEEFQESGWGLIALKDGFNLATPPGRAMAGMCAVFNALERDLTRERTLAGLERVRAQGKRLGPPMGNQNARKHPKRTPPANPGQIAPMIPHMNQSGVRFDRADRVQQSDTVPPGKEAAP